MFTRTVRGHVRLLTLITSAIMVAALATPTWAAKPGMTNPTANPDGSGGSGARSTDPLGAYFLYGDFTNGPGTAWTYFNSAGGGWRFESTSAGSYALVGAQLNASSTLAGVYGVSANGYGVWGKHDAASGVVPGVYGDTDSTSAAAFAIVGVVNPASPGSSSTALRGISNGTGGSGIGVWGSQAGTGYGVYGATSGAGYGVYGVASGNGGRGVYGSNSTGVGVYGYSSGSGAASYGVYGNSGNVGVYGISSAATGTAGISTSGIGLYGESATGSGFYGFSSNGPGGVMGSNTTEGARFYTRAAGANKYALVTGGIAGTYGNVYITGNYQATGTKSARVETSQGPRLMYAGESTKNIFTDQGSATLVNGRAVITIDSLYAQTVNLKEAYQVFVTPNSASTLGLAVINKTSTSFEVRELGNGTGNFSFDWRIDGLRKGYESDRMEDAGPAPTASGPAYDRPTMVAPATTVDENATGR